MSRIGRMPIEIPPKTEVDIKESFITVKGPKGELSRGLHPEINVAIEEGKILVTRPSDSYQHRALHGLTRSLVANMVEGVTKGFEKTLEIVGVGYKVEKTGENLTIRIGYSHPVIVSPLPGNMLTADGPNRIRVSGANKETVGQQAAKIRAIRPPDAYKGKGVRYAGEKIQLKAGKTVGKGA